MARIKNGSTFHRIGNPTPGYPETSSATVTIVTTGGGNTTYSAGGAEWIVNSEFFNTHYAPSKRGLPAKASKPTRPASKGRSKPAKKAAPKAKRTVREASPATFAE